MKQLLRMNWAIFLVLFGISIQGQAQVTFSKMVDASTDDAEEQGANGSSPGTMDLTSSDLELVNDGNDGDQFVGIRFSNITIPSGALITKAYIQFTVDEDDDIAGTKYIFVEDTDNGTTFSSTAFDISSRARTADSVTWDNIPVWPTAGVAGADQRTPDLTALVQSIFDRGGWSSGNAINFIITGTGERVAESYDGVASAAPELVIEYLLPLNAEFPVMASSDDAEEQGANGSSPGTMDLTSSDLELVNDGNDGDQFVGIRFANISLPQNALITSAYIQFTVDEDDDIAGDKFIFVEDVANGTTFSSANFDISSRNRSTDSVIWSNIPVWPTAGVAGVDQRTPSVKSLVQNIVNKSAWMSGNAINFIITGTGERVAESYDGVAASAPKLVVNYLLPIQNDYQVSASSDDAEEQGANGSSPGTMDLTSSDLELVNDGNDGDQFVGMRFTNLDIDPGEQILSAYVQFTVDEDDDIAGDKFIFIEDVDNSSTFTSTSFDISSRPLSADSVVWSNIPVWPTTGVAGIDQRTPDLTALIQAHVNRPGWANGNALNIIMKGTGERVAESYDGVASSAPILVIKTASSQQPPFEVGDFPVQAGSEWKFNDSGMDLGTAWTAPTYNDSTWTYGPAILGYGNGNESTILDFGSDASNKYVTTYLRHNFNVVDPSIYSSLKFKVLRDDGVIVYLNGVEVFRQNMPASGVSYTTLASSTVGGINETTFFEQIIPNSLVAGENVIAVELHQASLSSSDLSFDLELEGIEPQGTVRSGCWQPQQSFDDVEEGAIGSGFDGDMYNNSSDLELTWDGGEQIIGIRFPGVSIPQGATIQNAYIQFTVDEDDAAPGTLHIKGEATDNSVLFSTTSFDLSSRDTTNSSVEWSNIPVWSTVGQAGPDQRTPDLSSIIQEIVDRPGWADGNALMLSISGTGERVAESYDGSPASAPKLCVTYELNSFQNGGFPIAVNSLWKFDTTGTDLGSSWKETTYNDSAWDFGSTIAGYGNGNELTTLDFGPDPSNKYPTHYFRHNFDVKNAFLIDSLRFKVLRDDGVVVYVNGVEAFRQNIPAGAVSFNTLAPNTVAGTDETTYFESIAVSNLVEGENLIAVEVHQRDVFSSDLSFDMEVTPILGPAPIDTFPIPKESIWSYLDDGSSLDGTNWTSGSYDYSEWSYEFGDFGFGDGQNTELRAGFITYYFKKDIYIDDYTNLSDSVIMMLKRDDGAVVYVNGNEVARYNLPAGAITSSTLALAFATNELDYEGYIIPKSAFQPGMNNLAVEIHNVAFDNVDLSFDMELKELNINNQTTCDPATNDHIGCFVSIDPRDKDQTIRIPSTHRFQLLAQQGDSYTIGGGTMPGNNDFTGYIGMNNMSSRAGVLGINHEISPVGGVSMLDITFDDEVNLWDVDSSRAVDFTDNALGGRTSNNCSGGITPWGTYLTTEEYPNATDVNNDGYNDVGWIVEIDPVTKKVRDYGTGTPTKLYAMGWFSHENAAPAQDSVTVYMGEDGGTSCVYKFVAAKKTDLREGELFVLSLDDPLDPFGDPTGTTARWVKVPNTTQNERNNTRSLAASVGGTFFNSVEDVEVGTVDGKIYFTSKGFGRIYRFANATDSTVSDFESWVGGQSYPIITEEEVVFTNFGSGIDNLAFDDEGNLYGMQDGGEDHIWVIRPGHTQEFPEVEIFMTTPAGSEPTGMTFSPDYRYMFVSIQHPSGSNSQTQLDGAFEEVTFNASSTVVIARKQYLGLQAPVADFTASATTILAGDSITFTDVSTFRPDSLYWLFESGDPQTATNLSNPSVTYNLPGNYLVKLEAFNKAGADTVLKNAYVEVISSIDELPREDVMVYPNPFGSQVNIDLNVKGLKDVSIRLYDLQGRLLDEAYQGTHNTGRHLIQLPMEAYSSAVIMMIQVGDKRTVRRLLRK